MNSPNEPPRTDRQNAHGLKTATQVRKNLLRAGIALVLLLALTLSTLFTPIFDGSVGGVGIAYIVGFADFVIVLIIAAVHCIESNRADLGIGGAR